MKHLQWNIEVTITSKDLTANDKVQAVWNELREQYTIYPDELYEDDKLRGKAIDPEDFIHSDEEWDFDIETPEERYDTNIDSLYLEEGLDVDLLYRVREHHNIEEVPEDVVEKYDDLSDCMTIDNSPRDKRKFFVMNVPWYRTEYHSLPGWGMISTQVKSNSPYLRKVIWNEEGNFEEIETDDKPDWLIESEERNEAIADFKREEKAMKMLRRQIRVDRNKYKRLYNAMEKIKDINPKRASQLKKRWDYYYKDYLKRSKIMDSIKAINDKIELKKKQKEAETILSYFVDFQQIAPSNILDKLLREDVKKYYKKYWYTATISYLKKCIAKAKTLA